MDLESLKALFAARVQAWEASQKDQGSGFEYERSFDQMWTELGRELLEQSTASSSTPSKKNSNDEVRGGDDA